MFINIPSIKYKKSHGSWKSIELYNEKIHNKTARLLWLTPVFLPTWEAEIRRIKVQGQPWQIVARLHLQNN
jgi:hypothetical protein